MNPAVAAGAGLGLGVLTGIPLGVINAAIADAAAAVRRRFAIGLGLGGAAADAVHGAVAAAGESSSGRVDRAAIRTAARAGCS